MRILRLIASLLGTLIVGATAFAVLVGGGVALILAGPPSVDQRCADREVTIAPLLSTVFESNWQSLLAGRDAVNFTESQSSTRAGEYLSERSSAIHDVVICFDDDAGATARALVDVSLGGVGFGSVFVEASGTADLSGETLAVRLDGVRLGRLPAALSARIAQPTVQRTIDEQTAAIGTPGELDVRYDDGEVVVVRTGG